MANYNGTAGNDYMVGTNGDDNFYAAEGDDVMNGLDGNNSFFGYTGNDTVILLGNRGDWTFATDSFGNVDAWNELYDISAHLNSIETLDFVLSEGEPEGAFINTRQNNTFTGTAEHDVFFFDPQMGLKTGYDTINGFGAGDRIVTTTALADWNSDGVTNAQHNGNGYHLYNNEGTSMGRVAVNSASGAVGALVLTDTMHVDGVDYFIYQQLGDATVPVELIF